MIRVDKTGSLCAKAKNLASRHVGIIPTAFSARTALFARRITPNGSARPDFSRPSFWPPSQFFTGQRRRLTSICTTAVICFTFSACRAQSNNETAHRQEAVASIRNQPTGFNRHVRNDAATDVLNSLTQSRLVRINKETQDTEPWLAESWTTDEPGRRYTLKLRQGLRFSDGHPFSADDVLFSFQAAYGTYQGRHSVVGGVVQVGDKPLVVAKIDANTVSVTFPAGVRPWRAAAR